MEKQHFQEIRLVSTKMMCLQVEVDQFNHGIYKLLMTIFCHE